MLLRLQEAASYTSPSASDVEFTSTDKPSTYSLVDEIWQLECFLLNVYLVLAPHPMKSKLPPSYPSIHPCSLRKVLEKDWINQTKLQALKWPRQWNFFLVNVAILKKMFKMMNYWSTNRLISTNSRRQIESHYDDNDDVHDRWWFLLMTDILVVELALCSHLLLVLMSSS